MLKLWKSAPAPTHEELFIKYYEQLSAWARQLTGQSQQNAEDLVHDVFIQFTLVQPELSEIDNLEGYLFAMMRNLLRSQMRREARGLGQALSLVDYDSAEIGLRAVDPRAHLRVRDELNLICHYASVRKETSRAGSALILRFFLGYYPSEISLILRSSRQAVADLLNAARHEAKLYLSQPKRLSFMRENPAFQAQAGEAMDDFLGELRRSVFRSCQGTCLSKRKLRELYRAPGPEAIPSKVFSHIVSCPHCLDIVNQELGLPLLSDRHPTDTLGPDQRGGSGSGGEGGDDRGGRMSANVTKEAVKRFRRRLQEVIEHEPKELHIAINGRVLGSQAVNAEWNRQNLHLDDPEPVGFIEVFSEQGIKLLALNVEPPPAGPFERLAQIALSEQRTLQVALRFHGPGAHLEVIYHYPNFKIAGEAPAALPSPWPSALPSALPSPLIAEPGETHTAVEEKKERRRNRLNPFASLLPTRRFNPWFWLRPGVLSAAVAVLLIMALVFFRAPAPRVSAAELLRRSAASEATTASKTDLVLHRALNLEERDPSNRSLLSRRRVEIWQSAGRGVKARRVYNEQDQLIAGEWRKADGSRIIYQRGGEPQEQPASRASVPAQIDEAWQLEPSADDFSALIGRADAATIEEKADVYVLSFVNQRADDGQRANDGRGLQSAALTLSRGDLHAIDQTLLVRINDRQPQLVEYHFTETRFERHPVSAVAAQVFEPEPELLPKKEEVRKIVPENKAAPSPSPLPLPAAVATAELEIEALSLLNQIGATLGEEVSVARTLDGSLRIEGVVENAERKSLILSALSPVKNHPAVKLQIETPEEAEQRLQQLRRPSDPVTVQIQEAAPSSSAIPVDAEVRRYLMAQGTAADKLDEEVNQFANRTLRRSRQAMLYAWSLRKLVQRFSPNELRALDAMARAKWLALIGEHARGYQGEIAALRQELSPIFNAESPAEEIVSEMADESDLARAVLRLNELGTATDEAIRLAFTLSASGSPAIKSPQFWRTLGSAELLAAKIVGSRQ